MIHSQEQTGRGPTMWVSGSVAQKGATSLGSPWLLSPEVVDLTKG